MVFTSLKPVGETMSIPPTIFPKHLVWDAYTKVFHEGLFVRYIINSFYISLVTTFISLIFAVMAGLGFSRFRFRGDQGFQLGILITQLFPLILLVPPYFLLMKKLGLLDTHLSLIITYTAFILPFSIWMMTTYFRSVPVDMEEAAMIDGCSRFGAYLRVTIPLAAPGMMATAIFGFVLAWNEFVFVNTFINTPELRTLPIGLRTFIGQYSTEWNVLMAMSVITTLPIVVIFVVLQKHFIRAMTAGSIKG